MQDSVKRIFIKVQAKSCNIRTSLQCLTCMRWKHYLSAL